MQLDSLGSDDVNEDAIRNLICLFKLTTDLVKKKVSVWDDTYDKDRPA